MSKIADYLGKIINASLNTLTMDVKNDLQKLQTEVEKQNRKIDENEKDRIRWEILSFANSCHSGVNHTKDEFDHIINLNKKYEKLLVETGDTNGVFEIEYKYVKALYEKKLEEKTFLNPELVA